MPTRMYSLWQRNTEFMAALRRRLFSEHALMNGSMPIIWAQDVINHGGRQSRKPESLFDSKDSMCYILTAAGDLTCRLKPLGEGFQME